VGEDPLRVAVVGSGPAGFYAAGALLASEDPRVEVDLIDRLPTPWGLVRLGVAPDHPNIKAVSRAFEKIAAQPGFRFLGNVEVGRDVTQAELAELYGAVVYAIGAQTDRRLGIPEEDLPGSWPATAFVAWYNGHPDFQDLEFDLSHGRAVVIGNRKCALDVARMLALTQEELAPTDTTDAAIEAINAAGVREILVVGRRGPVQAAWTPVEVGELGELAGGDILVDPADLELDPASAAELEAAPPTVKRNVEHLRAYAARAPEGKPRAIRLRFLRSPVAILGEEKVEAMSWCGTSSSTDAPSRPTIARWSSAGSSFGAWATGASRCRASRSTTGRAPCRTTAAVSATRREMRCRAPTAPDGSSAVQPG
jgi:ferredoxin--NADP+ reductase